MAQCLDCASLCHSCRVHCFYIKVWDTICSSSYSLRDCHLKQFFRLKFFCCRSDQRRLTWLDAIRKFLLWGICRWFCGFNRHYCRDNFYKKFSYWLMFSDILIRTYEESFICICGVIIETLYNNSVSNCVKGTTSSQEHGCHHYNENLFHGLWFEFLHNW